MLIIVINWPSVFARQSGNLRPDSSQTVAKEKLSTEEEKLDFGRCDVIRLICLSIFAENDDTEVFGKELVMNKYKQDFKQMRIAMSEKIWL